MAEMKKHRHNIGHTILKYLPFLGSRRKNEEPAKIPERAPRLSQICISEPSKSFLIDCSSTAFGSVCERLVSIAFNMSRMFPTVMGSYHEVSEYLRKELQRQYPRKNFHIIISEDQTFSFATDLVNYFAILQQDEYQILIFSTGHKKKSEEIHQAVNGDIKFRWKSVTVSS